MTGYQSKKKAAQDKLDSTVRDALEQMLYLVDQMVLNKAAELNQWDVDNIVKQASDALEQPEQEPVAYWNFNSGFSHCMIDQLNEAAKKNPAPVYTTPPQRTVQVSPLEFVEMVMDKEHLVGNPVVWAQWPNKEKNNGT